MNHNTGPFESILEVASSAGDSILHLTSMLLMKLSVFHRATLIKVWFVKKKEEMCYGLHLKEGRGILFNKIKHSPGTLMMTDGYMHYLLTVGKRIE